MPMQNGYSRQAIAGNIKEMIKAGHKPRQAIAASIATARKAKKMAMGGKVEPESEMLSNGPEDYQRTLGEIAEQGDYHPQDVANPAEMEEDMDIAEAIRDKAREELGAEHYAMGGLVEGDVDGPLGNKPSEEMDGVTGEPMDDMPMRGGPLEHAMVSISEDARVALEERKKKRRYS